MPPDNPRVILVRSCVLKVKKRSPARKPKPSRPISQFMRKGLSALILSNMPLMSMMLAFCFESYLTMSCIDKGNPNCKPVEGRVTYTLLFPGKKAGFSVFDCGIRCAW